jgi:hypothetical protein
MKSRRPVNSIVMLLLLEGTMRLSVLAALVLCLSLTHAQAPSSTDKLPTTDVTRYQDLAYPTAGYLPPEISLPRALKIAEDFIKTDHIDISSCYLIEARWVTDDTKTKNGGWRFYWAHKEQVSRNVLIAVSLDGKPYRIHLM